MPSPAIYTLSLHDALPISSTDKPLPDGPGKTETQKLCSQCHDMDRSVSLRQDRAGWRKTIEKMLAFGAKATDQEFNRSEELTSELQSLRHLVCRLLLEKKK